MTYQHFLPSSWPPFSFCWKPLLLCRNCLAHLFSFAFAPWAFVWYPKTNRQTNPISVRQSIPCTFLRSVSFRIYVLCQAHLDLVVDTVLDLPHAVWVSTLPSSSLRGCLHISLITFGLISGFLFCFIGLWACFYVRVILFSITVIETSVRLPGVFPRHWLVRIFVVSDTCHSVKLHWHSGRHCIESIHHFVSCGHPNVNSSNPCRIQGLFVFICVIFNFL